MSNKPLQFSPLHFHQTVSEDGRKGYGISAIGSDFTICDMNMSNLPPEAVSQILPHMQLFVSAPELLEALQTANRLLENRKVVGAVRTQFGHGDWADSMTAIEAAIAKATGTTA